MFISITDLHIPDYDESTYFSVANIDSMQQPGETMKFDGNGDYEIDQWIQQRASQNTPELHYTNVVSSAAPSNLSVGSIELRTVEPRHSMSAMANF